MKKSLIEYGVGDNSYQAAGELSGLTKLVEQFYLNMTEIPAAKKIRDMHPEDLTVSKQKLTYFLSGWLGGPKSYAENFGSISIPQAHRHMDISEVESEMWLTCMKKAIDCQSYENTFKIYLIEALKVPAGRITQACATYRQST